MAKEIIKHTEVIAKADATQVKELEVVLEITKEQMGAIVNFTMNGMPMREAITKVTKATEWTKVVQLA